MEHRLVGADLVTDPQVQAGPSFCGGRAVERGGGSGVVPDTLLGPEGTASAAPSGLSKQVKPGQFIGKGGQGILSTARILRTTQWTRASLWSNY